MKTLFFSHLSHMAIGYNMMLKCVGKVQQSEYRTLQDHEYELVYLAICLFTSPAFAG